MTLHWFDLTILALYFAGIISLGLYVARKNKNTDDYFLGGRSFPGWAIGISLVGSMISSITFLAHPADAFKTAWIRFLPNLAFPVVVMVATYLFVPFFRRGTIISAYQYLGLRFGPGISAYAAILFLLVQIMRSATITYLLAMLLSPMVNLRVEWCILMAGAFTAIYSVKGGFEAVVWTEVVQTIILVLGAVCSIALIIHYLPGGLSQIISEASDAGKLSFMDLNDKTGTLEAPGYGLSLKEKTIPMLLVFGFVMHMTAKLDQTTVQRWCSARTAKEATKSMWILGLASVPVWAGFMFLGTCLWVYFQHNPSEVSTGILAGAHKAEEIMPHFIVSVLPPGLSGLVIAAALSASMATLAGCISASSMVWVHDIYRPFLVRNATERHYLRMGKLSALLVSMAMIAGAYCFYKADTKTFTDLGLTITALLGGGISSAFLLGILTRVGDQRAVLVGIVFTLAFSVWALLMQFGIIKPAFDLYYTALIGNVIMFVASYIAGLLMKPKPRDLTNLTIWDKSDAPLV